jgi:hypothetical protein
MILLKIKAMKKLIYTSILALLITGGSAMRAQDMPDEYLGLPGDNLNLYAVMKLFQESETLEAFERNLNDENSRINNLDLNGDNMVDYITVSDYVDGNVHTIVLRTAMSRNESQDVAVFTVEQLRNGEVRLQLIGDETLYGRNYIIEPNYAETPNPGYMGNRSDVTVVTTTYYDIAAWPVIRFIFHPAYIVWHSAWYWGYYPAFWNPWHPYYWHYYYGYQCNWYTHYYQYYHHGHDHYYAHYQDHYYNHIRTYSPAVTSGIHEGRYRSTYSRPEQRREGEALYARTNSGRNTRTQAGTSTGTGDRRTSAQPAQRMRTEATGTGTERRSTDVTAYRTRPNSSAGQNNAAVRRSATTLTERSSTTRPAEERATSTRMSTSPAGNRTAISPSETQRATSTQRSTSTAVKRPDASPSVSQRLATTQRSSPTAVNRTATAHSTTQRASTTRSSSSSVSQRTSSRPSTAVQRAAPSRNPESSAPKTVSRSSNNRSSSQVSKSAPAANRNSGARVSGTGKAQRR